MSSNLAMVHFRPGCTDANPDNSMMNVERRAGKNRDSYLSTYLSQPLAYSISIWSHTVGFDFSYVVHCSLNVRHYWSMVRNVRNSIHSNNISQPSDICHTALTGGPIPWYSISGLSFIHFLIADLVKDST
jgi:hypothetical protein